MKRRTIASKYEILDLIAMKKMLWVYMLIEVGYSEAGAYSRLWRLKKEGLVSPLYRGHKGIWVLTEKGYSRLWYAHDQGRYHSRYVEWARGRS
jgi:DNA-binding transcriptional regulator PaaX